MPPSANHCSPISFFPSIPDGKRCGETIRSIFDTAANPDKIVVGVIEQNDPEDDFCLSVYCGFYGVKTIRKQKIRTDMTKIIVEEGRTKCPRFDQIRLLAVFNVAAKGPADARALTRKIVGNEEFCLQVDAHTTFRQDWEKEAIEEWKKVGNEFAILSTVPADIAEKSDYEGWTATKSGEVPRQCLVTVAENDTPEYSSPADGKVVNLEKPLLSHAWSAAFSFAKCHIEETAPYDPFIPYVFGVEQFSRFARFWTRGYDVYTPTKNFIYHDYSSNGHDIKEWFRQRRERLRNESLHRVHTMLQIPGGDSSETAQANLGVYGLGRRRTIQQLMDFVGIDLVKKTGNRGHINCANKAWVPYDASTSPMANMFERATDLDPQPEFPLRDQLVFYQQVDQQGEVHEELVIAEQKEAMTPLVHTTVSSDPPASTLFILWIFGLIVWCAYFINIRGNGVTHSQARKKKGGTKDV